MSNVVTSGIRTLITLTVAVMLKQLAKIQSAQEVVCLAMASAYLELAAQLDPKLQKQQRAAFVKGVKAGLKGTRVSARTVRTYCAQAWRVLETLPTVRDEWADGTYRTSLDVALARCRARRPNGKRPVSAESVAARAIKTIKSVRGNKRAEVLKLIRAAF